MSRIVDILTYSHLRKSFAQLSHSFISSNNPAFSTSKLSTQKLLSTFLFPLSAILLLVSCGPDKSHIEIKGHLLNLNQAEFLVYSPDGATAGIDTIYISGGRFTYEPRCEHDGTVIILLPNHQEIPVFVTPGKSYSINGDAHNIKDLKVKGDETPETKAFRMMYDIRHQYLDIKTPDYHSASRKLAEAVKQYPDNTPLKVLQAEVMTLMNTSAGASVPSFQTKDINGANVSSSSLNSGITLYISQASWDFASTSQVNRLITVRNENTSKWKIVVISFDASRESCLHSLNLTDNGDHMIFDGMMSQTPLAKKFGIEQTGVAVVTKDGKIKERNKTGEELIQYLKTL